MEPYSIQHEYGAAPASGLTLPFPGVTADLHGSVVVRDDGGLYRVPARGGPATFSPAGIITAPELASPPLG